MVLLKNAELKSGSADFANLGDKKNKKQKGKGKQRTNVWRSGKKYIRYSSSLNYRCYEHLAVAVRGGGGGGHGGIFHQNMFFPPPPNLPPKIISNVLK